VPLLTDTFREALAQCSHLTERRAAPSPSFIPHRSKDCRFTHTPAKSRGP